MNETSNERSDSTHPNARMRTLVGIDGDGLYAAALDLLGRLRFAENEVSLVHVEPPIGPMPIPAPIVYDFETASELEGTLRTIGRRTLEEASERAKAAGLGDAHKTEYLVGNTAASLMEKADRDRSDLVAIGSKHHGAMECFLLGSVGRALAIGARQSFLIARGNSRPGGKVRAVFATDHSEYANRCFSRLLDMSPDGLGQVTIVTATESTLEMAIHGATGFDDRSPESITEAEDRARVLGEAMVGRLAARGVVSEYRLVEGVAEEAIRRTMKDTGSDLLILGARGHGLFERVLIGSLALHTVVAEPYAVLVLRMPEA